MQNKDIINEVRVQKLDRKSTKSTTYGAIIPPVRAQKLAIPKPVFLMTVGKSSAEYRKIVAKAAEEPTLPTRESRDITHCISVHKIQQLTGCMLK